MQALTYHGPEDVRVEERPRPGIVGEQDAILRVTTSGLCGSDLHLYHGDIPDTREGDVFGHEFVGIIEEVGPGVRAVRPGDRVVVSGAIADGTCRFCRRGEFSFCDGTNPNPVMIELYGQATAGIFGYSHLTGGFDGGQAEFVRVPFADVNCMHLPADVSDEAGVLLADNFCTGWHATVCADVEPGDTVAVFGCGPVGLLAMESCRLRGASEIFAIDRYPYRLEMARLRFGATIINYDEDDPVKTLREITYGYGPDACIDATGFRYSRTLRHRLQRKLKLETDAIDALSDAIRAVRKGGRVAPIGDYIGLANQFPVGAMMEKGVTVRGSQVHVQRYWRDLLERIRAGETDPTFVISHKTPLELAREAYRAFDRKRDGVFKIVFDVTAAAPSRREQVGALEARV